VWTGSWPGGGLQTLQFPGVDYSFGLGLNDHGKVVGQYLPNVGGSRGFIYDVAAGTYITLEPIVPNGGAGVWDINNAGIAVGSRTISQTAYNAFIWKNGVYTDLGVMNGPYSAARAISENGIVVGWTGTAIHTNNARAFVHQAGQTTILPMPPNGVACAGWAVNSSGDIVGGWKPQVPSGPPLSRGALWRNGLMIDLGLLPLQPSAAARGISDDGHVIIGASGEIGCVWRHENIANLNALIPTGTGVWITDAYAMNKRGEILCEASHASGRVAVVLTPVLAPPGDATLDCIVNVNDLLAVINAWGQTGGPADLNQDGIVNHLDLLIVINNWSSAP
jgi:probable HAF family extracellular repeat protein